MHVVLLVQPQTERLGRFSKKIHFQNGRLEIFDLGSAFVLSVKYNVQYVFHLAKLIVKYKYIRVLSQLQQSDCLSYSPTILW